MPILLDLFSGSLSWSKAFAELPGWESISIDNDPKYTETTYICDVLDWEIPERLHGSVDVVTIGVPCTAYSTANKKKPEESQEATRVLWDRNPWWFDLQSRISETRKVQSFGGSRRASIR